MLVGLLNEIKFFEWHNQLAKEPRIILSYTEADFPEEKAEALGGMVKAFHVSVGGRYYFTLRDKFILSALNLRYNLSEYEYHTIYENLEVLHRFAGASGVMLESKIGRVTSYNISKDESEFFGQFGNIYREKKYLARK